MRSSLHILKKPARWGFAAASHLFAAPRQSPFSLMYHSVDDSGTLFSTSPRTLRAHLDYLHEQGWTSMTSSEFVEAVLARQSPKKRIFISFDDGYTNFFTDAVPLLQEFGFTATVFVIPDLVGTRLSTHERDRQYIHKLATGPQSIRDQMDAAMEHAANVPLMTWELIEQVAAKGFDVQNHSATHHVLPSLSEAELNEDLSRSRKELQRRLGKTIDLLCYPFGGRDERVMRIARETGHRCAVIADRFGTDGDPMQASRFGMVDSVSVTDLAYFLSRGAQFEVQLRNRMAKRKLNSKKGSDDSR